MRCLRAIALAGGTLASSACDRGPAPPADVGTVIDVIDGDTVDIEIAGQEQRVRLLGIDTPEVFLADGAPPECFGPESSAFTAELLTDGARVRLERDVVGRDDYGRLLAYVYVLDDGAVTGGSMVNEAIVRQGYARPLIIAPNGAYATRFVAAATAAEAEGLGLWGGCGG
ncbi:MAG: thermonuclease family protein [Ilumatobacteraceae bacterium]